MKLLRALCLAVLLLPVEAAARTRVVVVQSDDLGPYVDPVPAFLEALGEPATVINLHGRRSDANALVRRLRDNPPTVVFALGAKAAWTVRTELPEIPLVYTAVMQPDRYGIEGPNVAGVVMTAHPTTFLSQFVGFFPEKRRIGFFRGPELPDATMQAFQRAAAEAGVELVVVEVDSPRAVRSAFQDLAPKVDALWLHPDRDILSAESFRTLANETRRRRMPLLVETDNMVRAGGLFAVVPDPEGVGTQAATIVRSIVDQRPPEQAAFYPDAVLVSLNLRTLELAEIPFDPLLLDFVDLVVE